MKKIMFILIVLASIAVMSACGNYDLFDTEYEFDRCIIKFPNGDILEGNVDSWCDYEGDQIQVEINGVYYVVHSSNIILISD